MEKKNERKRLLNQNRAQTQLAENKTSDDMFKRVYMNGYAQGNPVVSTQVLEEELKQLFPSAPIFEVDLSSLVQSEEGPSKTEDFQKIKEELSKVYELAESFHKEKGVNEEVEEAKRKTVEEIIQPKPVVRTKKTRWYSQLGLKLGLWSK